MKHVKNKYMESPAAHCGAELFEINMEIKGAMASVHELQLLVDKAQDSDCAACRAPLLHHIRTKVKHPTKKGYLIKAACGAEPLAPMVDAAMASDCDACRGAIGVALVRDKAWTGDTYGVRPEAVFESQPMENADEICASARANR